MPEWLREIDHTGDVGIVVTAPDLATLFERAGYGLFSILSDLERVEARHSVSVKAQADDASTLLVRWLSELNYLSQTERWIFNRFDVEDVTDRLVCGTVFGEVFDAARHQMYTEVKAVTFHDLELLATQDGFCAKVIFDV